jgi:hypothetical protein
MYFERWGLLVPPSGESVFEGYVVSAFPTCQSIPYHSKGVQRLAYGRTGVQEAIANSEPRNLLVAGLSTSGDYIGQQEW